MTELPKRELLEQKLHKAVELARKQLEVKPTESNTEYKWFQLYKTVSGIEIHGYFNLLRELNEEKKIMPVGSKKFGHWRLA